MEMLQVQQQRLSPSTFLMNTISVKCGETIRISSKFRSFSVSSLDLSTSRELVHGERCKVRVLKNGPRAKDKVPDAQLKENWLASLSCPFPNDVVLSNIEREDPTSNASSEWIFGIDPDIYGALALLKNDGSAQVFDSPHLEVLVGKRLRKRLDTKSMVQLLQSFDAPQGTIAYIEQSIPFPQDGKQGWWSSGFGYGLWLGILVASGFSVVPVPSRLWKNQFQLSGSRSGKDGSREAASTLFPSLSSLLKRKKDHGRAEALLIAAYGKGMRMKTDSCITLT